MSDKEDIYRYYSSEARKLSKEYRERKSKAEFYVAFTILRALTDHDLDESLRKSVVEVIMNHYSSLGPKSKKMFRNYVMFLLEDSGSDIYLDLINAIDKFDLEKASEG